MTAPGLPFAAQQLASLMGQGVPMQGVAPPPAVLPEDGLPRLSLMEPRAPSPGAVADARRGPGLFDRVRQGAESLFGVRDVDNIRARRAGLDAGLSRFGTTLLQLSGPQSRPVSVAQGLGAGIEAGRDAATGGVDRRAALDAQEVEVRRDFQKRQILQRFANADLTDPNTLREMATGLSAGGFLDEAKTVSDVLEGLSSEGGRAVEVDLNDRVQLYTPDGQTLLHEIQKGGKTTEQFTQSLQLANQFIRLTDEQAQTANNLGKVVAAAQRPSATGDVGLIFAFMKMIDPGSVVRESEFAVAQNTGGVFTRGWALFNRVRNGQRFEKNQRQDFVDTAMRLALSQRNTLTGHVQAMTEKAQRFGLDPRDVVTDFFRDVDFTGVEGDADLSAFEGGTEQDLLDSLTPEQRQRLGLDDPNNTDVLGGGRR